MTVSAGSVGCSPLGRDSPEPVVPAERRAEGRGDRERAAETAAVRTVSRRAERASADGESRSMSPVCPPERADCAAAAPNSPTAAPPADHRGPPRRQCSCSAAHRPHRRPPPAAHRPPPAAPAYRSLQLPSATRRPPLSTARCHRHQSVLQLPSEHQSYNRRRALQDPTWRLKTYTYP